MRAASVNEGGVSVHLQSTLHVQAPQRLSTLSTKAQSTTVTGGRELTLRRDLQRTVLDSIIFPNISGSQFTLNHLLYDRTNSLRQLIDAKPSLVLDGKRGQYAMFNQPIGSSGVAKIYLANDPVGKTRAAKLLNRELFGHNDAVERFEREADQKPFYHPNIVRYIDSARLPQAFIVMELINGSSLEDSINLLYGPVLNDPSHEVDFNDESQTILDEKQRLLSFFDTESKRLLKKKITRDLLGIVLDVAKADVHLHQRNRAHRDIKPGNIMIDVTPEGRLIGKLADLEFCSETSELEPGVITGTPLYMSPEQASGDAKLITAQSDTFALASIVYEIMTGRPPFYTTNQSVTDLLQSIINNEPRKISDECNEYPELAQLVDKSLNKDRLERPDPISFYILLRDILYEHDTKSNYDFSTL